MLPLHKPNAPCAKCGASRAATVWVERCCDEHEHLRRVCGTCGFFWKERPLDQSTFEEQEAAMPKPFPTYRYTTGD